MQTVTAPPSPASTTTTADAWHFAVRDAEPGDLAFILQPWLRSYYHDSAETYRDADQHPLSPVVLRRVRRELVAARLAHRPATVSISLTDLSPSWHWHPVPQSAYYPAQEAAIKRVLARAAVRVACDPAEPDVIYGWACGEPNILHYVYVKDAWRRHGIARALVTPFGDRFTFTHRTLAIEPLLWRFPDATYNPHAFDPR